MRKTMFKVFVVMAIILSSNLPALADRHGGYGGHGGHGDEWGLGLLLLPAIIAAEILTLPLRYPHYAEPPPVVVREQPPAYIPPQQPAAPVQNFPRPSDCPWERRRAAAPGRPRSCPSRRGRSAAPESRGARRGPANSFGERRASWAS